MELVNFAGNNEINGNRSDISVDEAVVDADREGAQEDAGETNATIGFLCSAAFGHKDSESGGSPKTGGVVSPDDRKAH